MRLDARNLSSSTVERHSSRAASARVTSSGSTLTITGVAATAFAMAWPQCWQYWPVVFSMTSYLPCRSLAP
jgi:hypothetical protein